MSFYTMLQYYRPRPPPAVTGDDLSRFVATLRGTGALEESGFLYVDVKFGQSIDQDYNGTTWEEPTAPGMAIIHDIEWDIEIKDPAGLQDIIEKLAGDERRVYRANVGLGAATDELLRPLTRINSPENKIDF